MALPFAPPASLSPSFVIARCDAGDVDDMCDIYYEAFKEDPGNSHWWSPDRRHMQAWMQRRMVRKLGDAGMRHFKIADAESGAMVAFARWDIPERSGHFGEWLGQPPVDVTRIVEEEPEKPKDAEQEVAASAPVAEPKQQKYADNDVPDGADPFLCQNFFSALTKASEKWYTKDMLGLSLICTSPHHHRRGAAKALIVPMLDLADSHGITTYLEATPAGKPIYERLGFRQVDSLNFDLGELTKNDLAGWYRLSIMTRQPRGGEQANQQ
ncbi:hypothetical protein LQW54_003548 [Pestalotiopsis sp. IQ-011]